MARRPTRSACRSLRRLRFYALDGAADLRTLVGNGSGKPDLQSAVAAARHRVHVSLHGRQAELEEAPDVMYFEAWPMRQEALLFGGLAYQRADYLELWKKLPARIDGVS